MRILVVDDQKSLNESISRALKVNGYQVDSVYDGRDAMDYMALVDYDCVVLDIMMPGMDGFEVVENMRRQGYDKPILFLSAKSHVDDRIKALKLGGDDYLVKPFSMEELLVRIRVLQRRRDRQSSNVYEISDLKLDLDSRQVTRAGQNIDLSQKEYLILLYLLRNKNLLVSRDQILEHVWGLDFDGISNIVDVYINYLRKKVDEPFESKLIKTIRGAGYSLRDEK